MVFLGLGVVAAEYVSGQAAVGDDGTDGVHAVDDMYRYMFMLARGDEEWWNAFYYYWYYCNFLKERDPDGMHMYICADDIAEKDELIVLWNDLESKDLFLMSKDMLEKEAGL